MGREAAAFASSAPGDSFTPSDATVVVQQLLSYPLLVEGHKADMRFYLLIDVGDERASGRLSPVFVRRAAVPYAAQSRPAEITNTAYRLRHGLLPDMRPLDRTPGISRNLHSQIVSQLDSLARALVNAYFWNAANESVAGSSGSVANRLILFQRRRACGQSLSSEPRLYFLELNPYPALFRGLPDCDEAVDQMLSREFLPLMIRSGSSPGVFRPGQACP